MAAHDADALALASISLMGAVLDDLNISSGDPNRSKKLVSAAMRRVQDPRVLAILKTFPHNGPPRLVSSTK